MILTLKYLLIQQGKCSLKDLATQLGISSELTRDMLQHYLKKGKIKRCSSMLNCQRSCGACSTKLDEHYEWVA